MNLTTTKADLVPALGHAASIADKKSTIPIVANVLLRAEKSGLFVAATDLVIAVGADVPASVEAPGALALDARRLREIVGGMPEQAIAIRSIDGNRIEIKSGKAKATLAGLPAADFPRLPDPREVPFSAISGTTLEQMIKRVLPSISPDLERTHMSGSCVESNGETLAMTSTDSFRLTHVERACAVPSLEPVIIPRAGLVAISRLLSGVADCSIAVAKRHVFVRAGATVVSCQLVEAQFPPWRQILPKEASRNSLVVDRAALLEAFQRCEALADMKTNGVALAFADGAIALRSHTSDVGEMSDSIAADITGKPADVGVNARYAIEMISNMDGAELAMEINGTDGPIVLRPKGGGDSHLVLIMPLRG